MKKSKLRYKKQKKIHHVIAKHIYENKILAWFQGSSEFGPRALGARSIIGDPRNSEMQTKMNLSIKFRESFRPFAPSVLEEDFSKFFELNTPSPYMLLVAPVLHNIRKKLSAEDTRDMKNPNLLKRVKIKRSSLPATTHVDYSARVQTVDEKRNGRYYRLIREFKKSCDSPVLVNTSFNIRGEPIACTPRDAYRCFVSTDMDVLVLENFVLLKTEQPEESVKEKEKYIASFDLD